MIQVWTWTPETFSHLKSGKSAATYKLTHVLVPFCTYTLSSATYTHVFSDVLQPKVFSGYLNWVRSHAPSIRSHRGTKVVWPDFQPMRVPEEPVTLIYFGKIQFLNPCIWNIPFMSYRLWGAVLSAFINWRSGKNFLQFLIIQSHERNIKPFSAA